MNLNAIVDSLDLAAAPSYADLQASMTAGLAAAGIQAKSEQGAITRKLICTCLTELGKPLGQFAPFADAPTAP